MSIKFQKNDIVRGTASAPYGITNDCMTAGRVISTESDGSFSVLITEYPSAPSEIGEVYNNLDPQYFELIEHRELKPFNRLEALAALAKDKSALLYYDLSSANLSGSDLSGSDLSGSNLRSANLSGSDLSGSNLRSANLSGSDLSGSDLSGSTGIMSAIAFMDAHFERTKDGFIAYKTFGSSYSPNSDWKIEPGSVLTEVVNPDRACSCGCGINVAPLGWVKDNATNGGRLSIWKVLIRWEWLMGIVVPFGSDGKVRCEKVELIEVVK